MGLGFSVGEARWSYGGFARFRRKLAEELDLDLEKVHKCCGSRGPRFECAEHDDDIMMLLNHSDCDGRLIPSECRKVGLRLLSLIAHWERDDIDRHQGIELATAMAE